MTRDDIIRMAREASEYADQEWPSYKGRSYWYECRDERLANLVATAEREACAKVCDAKAAEWRKEAQRHLPRYRSDHAERDLARAAICEADAAAIRARSQQTGAAP